MDRNAIVLYLKEVRDLEFAQCKILQSYREEKNNFEKTRQDMLAPRVSEPGSRSESSYNVEVAKIIGCVIGGIALTPIPLGLVISLYLWYKAFKMYLDLKSFIKFSKEMDELWRESIEDYRADQARIERNREVFISVEEQWNQKSKFWQDEYHTVKTLLEDYYSANILPKSYRNIQSAYYLYEYMSTSRESLKDALLHEHMENGIQRILQRLDQIIAQNEEIIFHLRIVEAQNQEMIDQNYKMISELDETKDIAGDVSKKIEVGNSYLRANTFFAAAEYLNY